MDLQLTSTHLSINQSIYPSIDPSTFLSIHLISCAWEADKPEETVTILLWKAFSRDFSTAHHGAGKLSILPVLHMVENGQYFVVVWRHRPLICVPVGSLSSKLTAGATCFLWLGSLCGMDATDTAMLVILDHIFQCCFGWFLLLFGVLCFFQLQQSPAKSATAPDYLLLKLLKTSTFYCA
jgi:hypothetical protein